MFFRKSVVFVLFVLHGGAAMAGLFDDEEARKAILDLRQRVETVRQSVDTNRQESDQGLGRANEDIALLRRSLLELQGQIESLRSELARVRGVNEQLARELADVQRRQKDASQSVDDRLRRLEPLRVTVDGREFVAEPAEKRDYEAALVVFRKGDFPAAQSLLSEFFKRYPQSGYAPSVLFWLGNAEYATRDYKEAMGHFRTLLTKAPDHMHAAEAALSIANCQIELKDVRGARKTLDEVIKVYPQSEAAQAAKDRLLRLK